MENGKGSIVEKRDQSAVGYSALYGPATHSFNGSTEIVSKGIRCIAENGEKLTSAREPRRLCFVRVPPRCRVSSVYLRQLPTVCRNMPPKHAFQNLRFARLAPHIRTQLLAAMFIPRIHLNPHFKNLI